MEQKFLNVLGLISKARKFVYGEKLSDKIKANKVFLVIISTDMSENQMKKLKNKCINSKIEVLVDYINSEQLSKAIGKENIKAIGITDINFINLIKKNY